MKPSLWIKGLVLHIFIIMAALKTSYGNSFDCLMGLSYGKKTVDCTHQALQNVPGDLPREAQKLFLSYNNLSRIVDEFGTINCSQRSDLELCSKFPHMLELYISNNLIEEISPYSLLGMKQLHVIVLKNNLLKALHSDTFSDNRLLTVIDLSGNSIAFVDPELFQNLEYLHFLSLENNRIRNIHCDSFRGLVHLNTLLINSNLITHLDSQIFRDLSELVMLRIDENHLYYFSDDLFKSLVSLRTLNASKNNFSFLSSLFLKEMGKLENFDVSYNSVSKISRYQLQDLLKMKTVNFSFNNLSSLYLSNIPITFTDNSDVKVLATEYEICKDDFVNDIPCFVSDVAFYNFGKTVFHQFDFSYNNINEIIFSKDQVSHSLELLKLSLAGNNALQFPVSLLKQERYIVQLNLDKTNLDWKNVTLFNEILQLPQLKLLSLVGCTACEFYMQQILFSVFNPNGQVSIICGIDEAVSLNGTSHSKSLASGSDSGGKYDDESLDNNFTGNFSEIFDVAENFSYSCEYPCECVHEEMEIWEILQDTVATMKCRYTMDCSYSSLSVIPGLKQYVSCVLMSHNHIKEVKVNHFYNSPEIIYLDLSFNNLNELPHGIFNALNHLEFLKLNNNHLVYLAASLFTNLTNLSILVLHDNKIASYDVDTFVDLQNLFFLSIDFTNLMRFHDAMLDNQLELKFLVINGKLNSSSPSGISLNFKNLHNLIRCKINGLNLNLTFRSNFLQASMLNKLEFENNLLPVITDGLFTLIKNVYFLSLRENKIRIIEKNAFRYLSKLTKLDVSHNLIEYLHCDLFLDTVELSSLNASNNRIFYIMQRIFEPLSKLAILDISSNNIVGIKWNMFSKLPNLHQVHLHHNNIATLNESYLGVSSCASSSKIMLCDECFENGNKTFPLLTNTKNDGINSTTMSKLEIIYFSDNNVGGLEKNTFIEYPFLRVLSFRYNSISQLDNEVFKSTVLLKQLELHHNHIASINSTLFRHLTQLEILLLDHNYLEFIEEGAFLDLHMLKVLTLHSNRLKCFDPMLQSYNSLEILTLNDNYITHWNTKQYFPHLTNLHLQMNPLKIVTFHDTMPSLIELQLAGTSVVTFEKDCFRYLSKLRTLGLGENCVGGLSPSLFANVPNLIFLHIFFPATLHCDVNSRLDWRNITLINHWFEMSFLDYIIIAGHPICEDTQWAQVIENIFLSERWKIVICEYNYEIPKWAVSRDGNVLFILNPQYVNVDYVQ